MTVDWEVVGANQLTVFIHDMARWNTATLLGFNDDSFTETGCFVFFNTIGDTFRYVFKLDATSTFCYDDGVEWVPLGNDGALFNFVAIVDEEL